MSNNKALKAAKAALDSQDYDKAIEQAQNVLSSDPSNYFAQLFLARAHEKKVNLVAAADGYEAAAKLRPNDTQAWQGLCSVYETQGNPAQKEPAEERTAQRPNNQPAT